MTTLYKKDYIDINFHETLAVFNNLNFIRIKPFKEKSISINFLRKKSFNFFSFLILNPENQCTLGILSTIKQ